MSTGREAELYVVEAVERDLDLSIDWGCVAGNGWFIGLLEIGLMTCGRSWPLTTVRKPMVDKKTQTDRFKIFFKFFKT